MNEDVTRPLPHSIVAEKSVLSTFLQNPETINEADRLTRDHFYLPAHRIVFDKLREKAAAGQLVEPAALIQTFLDCGTLDSIGGPATIAELYTYNPSATNLAHYVAVLNDKLSRRIALRAAEGIIEAAYQQDEPAALLEATGAPIQAIHDTMLSLKPTEDMGMVIERVMNDLQAKIEGRKSPMGIETGIPCFDRRFLGLHAGRTTIISGYPSGGKSVLAGQLCAEAFLREHRTLFVSLEMPKHQLAERLICYIARLKGKAISNPLEYAAEASNGHIKTMDKGTLQKIANATRRMKDAPFDIEHLTGANEQMIAATIRKHHRKNHLKVVAVDFAQRIRASSDTRRENREQQLSAASKVLADLAQELGFSLLLLSQLNKEGAAKHAEALNEDCDLHLQILQDAATKKHIGIAVPKDRHHGQVGALMPVVLNEEFVRFDEITRTEEPKPGYHQ